MNIKKLLRAICILPFALSLQASLPLQTNLTNAKNALVNAQSKLQSLLGTKDTKSVIESPVTYAFKNTSVLPCIVTTTLNYSGQPNMTYKDISKIGATYTYGIDTKASQVNINLHFDISSIYQMHTGNNSYNVNLSNGTLQVTTNPNAANTKSVIVNNTGFDILVNFGLDNKEDNQKVLALNQRLPLPENTDSITIIPLIADYNITETINSSSKSKIWTITNKNGNFAMIAA